MDLKKDGKCPQCGRYANRGVTVDAVIVRDGKILLIKRGAEPFKGFWALPGGYVGWDETAENAVRREVAEETGLVIKSLQMIGVYSDPARHPEQCINVAFVAGIGNGEPKAGDDALDYEWTAMGSLPELAFDHGSIIDDYLEFAQTEK